MYRSISAFSYTVPEVFETTGTVGGEPETATRKRGQRGIHYSGGGKGTSEWTRTRTYWHRRTLWDVFSRERDEERLEGLGVVLGRGCPSSSMIMGEE
jgi:hypothetical protein